MPRASWRRSASDGGWPGSSCAAAGVPSWIHRFAKIVPPGSAYTDFHDTSLWHVGPLTQS